MHKNVEDMRPSDFEHFPVWEFVLGAEAESDTMLNPVHALPVDNLDNRIVGTRVRLENGALMAAMLSNVDLADPKKTLHFATLSIFDGQSWQHLSRYHDPDYSRHGPDALAVALKLPLELVFPIVYDLRPCCIGNPLCVAGVFAAVPAEMLSRSEIISLAVG